MICAARVPGAPALQAVQDPVRPAEQPIELSFQESYGDIEQHLWFGEGYILIGFRTGVPSMVAGPSCSLVAAATKQHLIVRHEQQHDRATWPA